MSGVYISLCHVPSISQAQIYQQNTRSGNTGTYLSKARSLNHMDAGSIRQINEAQPADMTNIDTPITSWSCSPQHYLNKSSPRKKRRVNF